MTNQAAQTMPELPEKSGRATIKVSPGKYQTRDLYTAAQMYQYARDYAALSQTAVVAEPGRYFAGGPQGHFFADDLQLARDLVNLYDKDDDWTITDLRNPTGAAPAASGGECHKPCTPIDFFNGDACPDCVTRDYSPQPPSAAPASGAHPDALPDGTLSKSTAKRLAAASVSERARELLAEEWKRDGHPAMAHALLNADLLSDKNPAIRAITRALEQALAQQRACATCGGRGEIGGHVGQTAETFDYITEPCPECTTPQPSADAVREIYDAAAKGFHTSETNGAERKYLHVIRFQSIEDLHGYEDAWTAAMVKARDAK